MLNEHDGSEILAAVFKSAGLEIERDYAFSEGGVTVSLDGFDPKARIGFEFITTEAGDRDEFTPPVIDELETRMQAEELFIFLIDEADIPSREPLEAAARGFLALLRDRGRLA
jgi:hypothetical protein